MPDERGERDLRNTRLRRLTELELQTISPQNLAKFNAITARQREQRDRQRQDPDMPPLGNPN
jgi:hypothetical protein